MRCLSAVFNFVGGRKMQKLTHNSNVQYYVLIIVILLGTIVGVTVFNAFPEMFYGRLLIPAA